MDSKLDWELVQIKGSKKISLNFGDNSIRFESDAPYYPNIDAIRIADTQKDINFENKGYKDFVNQLKDDSSKEKEKEKNKKNQEEIDLEAKKMNTENNSSTLRSAMLPANSYDWQVYPTQLNNPEGNYKHMMQVPITFTYYRKLSLSAGTYTFTTAPVGTDSYYAVDPVMYLYKINDPHNYSFYNDDNSGYGYHSKISVSNIPAGDYYLVIRAYSGYYASSSLGRQGLVNVYQNGILLNRDMPVAGYKFDVSSPNRGLLNFFTSYTTGIPVIWLIENGSNKMKFMGGQYFYADPMDFMWWDDARMRLTKYSGENYSMMISAEGAMGFYFGNCDAYGSCLSDPGTLGGFPNLKTNDIIVSAPSTDTYNCTAWTGGITRGWFWGGLYTSRTSGQLIENINYGSPYVWSTWDNYYGNIPARYVGATTYTRDQADYSNGEIAMWSTNGDISAVTHGSIRMVGNNHPHGYDWESKAGTNYRFFHPRNALEDFSKIWNGYQYIHVGYGGIFAYYRDARKDPYISYLRSSDQNDSERSHNILIRSGKSNSDEPVFTMEESIKNGLTTIEEVQLDADQLEILKTKSSKLRSSSTLQSLYEDWVNKMKAPEFAYISNPYTLIEMEGGQKLIEYAKSNLDESIVFFANIIFSNDENTFFEKSISHYLFSIIAKDKYAELMETVKQEWENANYDNTGRYTAPMPETFTKKYIKKILDKAILKKSDNLKSTTAIDVLNNDKSISVIPNPVEDFAEINLNLSKKSNTFIAIYDQSGHLIQNIVNGQLIVAGNHKFSINANLLKQGLNICVIKVDGVSYVRKILKK